MDDNGDDPADDEERGTTSQGDEVAPIDGAPAGETGSGDRGGAPTGYGEVQPTSDPQTHRQTAERLEGQNRQADDTQGQRAEDPGLANIGVDPSDRDEESPGGQDSHAASDQRRGAFADDEDR